MEELADGRVTEMSTLPLQPAGATMHASTCTHTHTHLGVHKASKKFTCKACKYHRLQHMQTERLQAQNKGSRSLCSIDLDPIHWCTNPQESDGGQHALAETSISMGLGEACWGSRRGTKEDIRRQQ